MPGFFLGAALLEKQSPRPVFRFKRLSHSILNLCRISFLVGLELSRAGDIGHGKTVLATSIQMLYE